MTMTIMMMMVMMRTRFVGTTLFSDIKLSHDVEKKSAENKNVLD